MNPTKVLSVFGALALCSITTLAQSPSPTPQQRLPPGSFSLRAQSTYPAMDLRHAAFLETTRSISANSAGTVKIDALPAGAVVPAFAAMDAVAEGRLHAAWVSARFLLGKDRTFAVVEGVPFGLDPDNYVAWRNSRNASVIVERLYRRFGVVGLACGVTAPHGDIWVKRPIAAMEDLKGLKIRAVDMQINMFAKVGAVVNALPTGEIVPAMDRGVLDAAILLDPKSDLAYGLPKVSRTYMVGQLHGARGLDLIINAALWDGLPPGARNAITSACQSNLRKMAAESTRIASEAINEMKKTVQIYKLPESVVSGLRSAWDEVRSEEMAKNATFAELAATMTAFESAKQRPDMSAYGLDNLDSPSAVSVSAVCRDPTLEPDRFRVQGVEMTDTHTGLVWLRCPAGYVPPSGKCDSSSVLPSETWEGAMRGPIKTAQTPPGKWRLASIEEFESIAAKGCGYLVDDNYIEIMFGIVWTSSSAGNDMVWLLDGNKGRVKLPKKSKDPVTGNDFLAQAFYVRNAEPSETRPALAAPPAQPASSATSIEAVSYVNGRPIAKSLFDAYKRLSAARGVNVGDPNVMTRIMAELVNREIIVQQAAARGIGTYPDPAMIRTPTDGEAFIAQQTALVQGYVREFLRERPVTEDAMRREYNDALAKTGATEYHAAHILVGKESEAQGLIDRLRRGESFEALAGQSLDTGSRDKGGDLNWNSPSNFVKPFSDAVVRLSPGAFTNAPVRTQFGWHVIKLHATRPVNFPSYESLKEKIKARLEQSLVERHLSDLRATANIQSN